MLIVQKYGGSSVADGERLANAARKVVAARSKGHRVVVVVSAQGDTTNRLLELARGINPDCSKRETDMLLATGEQQSCALLAMAIQKLGYSAISFDAWLAGINTTSAHTNARIKFIDTERITAALDRGQIVVVAGFQGINRHGDFTTLGRGASDLTAVALTAALDADFCEIYTDVDGVYSADPRIVADARLLPEVSYYEMLELASLGAKVLAKRSVGLAKKYGVKLFVKSSLTDAAGTIVKEAKAVEGIFVSGVVVDKDIARISITGIKDAPGVWYRVYSIMSKADISIDFVQQTKKDAGIKDISFTVAASHADDTIKALEDNRHRLDFVTAAKAFGIAKLSVVSTGMATNPGVPSLMFEALYGAGINIDSISTSEIRASVIIAENEAEHSARVVHKAFLEADFLEVRA